MEIYVCRALEAQIVRTLNKNNNTTYTRNDIELIEFHKTGIDIDTKDGNSYKIDGRNIWY